MLDEPQASVVALDVAYLASCAVRGESPDSQRAASFDIDAIYDMSRQHMLESACATALESAGILDERFRQARGKAVRKNAAMDIDRLSLQSSLDAAGIWYVLLKGCVLQSLYPVYGMRQMSDNDILYDSSRSVEVREIMEAAGFTTVYFGRGNHDVYHKEPVCNFELHRSLFGASYDKVVQAYYGNVLDRLLPDGHGGCGLLFSNEDFYVYMIAHEYKHFSGGGTGLRSLLDTYVYLRHYEDAMDWDYVRAECGKLGIAGFEDANRRLSQRLFNAEVLDDSDQAMLAYIVSSGTYGSMAHGVTNEVAKRGRIGYLVWRVFPPMDAMRSLYPVLGNAPMLLPACWAWRLLAAVAVKPKTVFYQLRMAMGIHGLHRHTQCLGKSCGYRRG